MIIAGLQKTTLVDYPGKVAATVFTRGCTFRCPFCHNPELVLPERFNPVVPTEDIFAFLDKRRGKLEGVCITGGEPMMHSDIDQFIANIKDLDYAVKLDTNGTFPDRLEKVIWDGKVDYIAMDIKSPVEKYQDTARPVINDVANKIRTSIKLIMESGIDYEFRTTVAKPLHQLGDFEYMGKLIQGAKRYYLQNFVATKRIDEDLPMQPLTDAEIAEARIIMSQYVKEVGVR